MKKMFVLTFLAMVFILTACTGKQGPTGPEGPEGPQVPGLYFVKIFQQGVFTSTYTGQVQTSLRNLQSGAYYTNSANPVNIGHNDATGETFRPILKFDLSSLPSTKVMVDKGELIIKTNSNNFGGGAINVKAYKVNSTWVVNQAGWQNSSTSTNWPFVGGDFSSNTITPNATSYDFLPDSTITIPLDPAVVQDWMTSPATNYGMLFRVTDEGTTNYSEIYSGGAATASNRPMLKVWYYTIE